MFGLELSLTILLIICLICALAFEFINGFHDTANAVATVIYTNSLQPGVAVVWSGIWNAIGVFAGGVSVAMGIISLLPVGSLVDQDVSTNISLVLSILISAIIWNLGTWYLGIPCSSSHTLIGSILGAGIAFTLWNGGDVADGGVNWGKAGEIGLSLLFSPLFGFGLTILLVFLLKKIFSPRHKVFQEPPKDKRPPFWIRAILILTCTGVSYSHGNNDGQKGIGLIMLILISIAPVQFALNMQNNPKEIAASLTATAEYMKSADVSKAKPSTQALVQSTSEVATAIAGQLQNLQSFSDLPEAQRFNVRTQLLDFSKNLKKITGDPSVKFSAKAEGLLKKNADLAISTINYAPLWVVFAVSLALGVGTMVGWKRIVITIGEKIGKEHLTYAQGAGAELVAAVTIWASSKLGLPVSTTQVLSSGIAGSMVATNGAQNLQFSTIRSIAIAWVLTLPVCIILAGILFSIFRFVL